MEIKAIETSYKGYRMRSRLEARYAIMFDEMEIKWEYEPEGFVLRDGTRYLPDFKIHKESKYGWTSIIWAEVKGCEPTHHELMKAYLLAHQLDCTVLFLIGTPGLNVIRSFDPRDCKPVLVTPRQKDPIESIYETFLRNGVNGYSNNVAIDAVNKAKSARFEFGENQ